ncbi:hypothetical protein HCN44_005849 [Aphidius gifuensis]|uniref:Decapping nuclease n=1 Tax=Aphidius gifuensis TaxID=684658 RepID=A0A834XV23_APHGI|nr:hypothetical protein HCN44_005849 [Aphidius gifuensis]
MLHRVEKNKNILLKLNKEEVPQTEFGPPRCVGYFSNGEGSWSPDASQLSYFYPLELSNIHIDLNHGIETLKYNFYPNEKIDHILKWIVLNYEKILAPPESQWRKWIEPDFIMTRSQLRKIMIAIYDEKARWIIRAVKFRGTIYLCPLDTEENKRWASNIPHRQKEHMLWGYNFEKFIFTSDPQQPPDLSQAVNTAETFNCMFQANLNNKLLMYSAEIDGVISDKKYDEPLPLDDLKFIEAKTIKYQLPNNSELKFLNWWCQSYTAGIENIICAFTNCKGIVNNIKEYKLSDIKQENQVYWNTECCFNFLDEFLSFLKDRVRDDYSETIYTFTKTPYEGISMESTPADSSTSFLPKWFTEFKKNMTD